MTKLTQNSVSREGKRGKKKEKEERMHDRSGSDIEKKKKKRGKEPQYNPPNSTTQPTALNLTAL